LSSMDANTEKYIAAFQAALEVDRDVAKQLEYQGVPEWDSVGHMALMGEIEDAFDITLEMDDIIDFSSFAKGAEILRKYGIEMDVK